MTSQDFTKVAYWVDMAIKGSIAIVMGIIGMDYKAVRSSLKDLEEKKYLVVQEIAILRNSLVITEARLDRIERKIDNLLERGK